ncbi:choline transporter-like protein 1 [Daphnia pulex]|uniref:Choline transporter-like protein 1 n=1 Tax=Daphnia pulex TaxID=6669 RepID=E9GBV9_DAPPU|nr:choline transporter-like protein 1 [Daphnia pulex]|eukprot:EFX83026.1 choline transporter-like protein 1 [Daphnia pulex]
MARPIKIESGESKEATYSLEKISEIFLTASSSKASSRVEHFIHQKTKWTPQKSWCMKRTKAKSFTREQLWVEANELAKEWANTLSNLPIPAFEGQLNAMKHLIEYEKIRPTEEKEATNLVNEQFMQIAIPNSTACETHEQLALNIEDDITKMAKELNSNQHNIDEQQQMETEVQQITEVVNELVVVPDVQKKNSERLKKLKELKLVNLKRRQGKEKSHYMLLNQQKADRKHLTHASQMSTAVLEDDVQSVLQSFENLFTEEGWKQLMTNSKNNLITNLKRYYSNLSLVHEQKQTTLEYICPTCRKPEGTKKEPWIFCDGHICKPGRKSCSSFGFGFFQPLLSSVNYSLISPHLTAQLNPFYNNLAHYWIGMAWYFQEAHVKRHSGPGPEWSGPE